MAGDNSALPRSGKPATPPEGGRVARTTFDPDIANVGRARAWAATQLRTRRPLPVGLIADIELVLSELMTNAIKAKATEIVLELRWDDALVVVVSVADNAAGDLVIRAPNRDATGGRGLPIVAALSTAWGVEPRPTGKRVWASVADRTA